jgi:hypothetical protein
MSASVTGNTYPKTRRIPLLAKLGVFAVVLVALAVGGSYLWQKHFPAVSQASAADCTLAQQILDSTSKIPTDAAAGTKWETGARARIQNVKEEFLASELRAYVGQATVKASGAGTVDAATAKNISTKIQSHCTQKLAIPPLAG